MRSRRVWLAAGLAAVVCLSFAVFPYDIDSGHACGGGGGAIWWRVHAASQTEGRARSDGAAMQLTLDQLAAHPPAVDAAHLDEFTADARDQLRVDNETIASIDQCDTTATERIGVAVVLAAAAAGGVFAISVGLRQLVSLIRRRRPPGSGPAVAQLCPLCGALLDDPVGCWNCEAFLDDGVWRRPADVPPLHARKLDPRHLERRRRGSRS